MDDVLGDTPAMPVSTTLDDLLGPEPDALVPMSSSAEGGPQVSQPIDLLDLLGDTDQV